MKEDKGKRNNRTFDNYRHNFRKPAAKKEQSSNFFLPPLALFESYEEVSPGITQKITDLAKVEQKHRHAMELQSLQVTAWTERIGQVLAFLLSLIILALTYTFAITYSDSLLAGVVCVSWFSFLIIGSIIGHSKNRKVKLYNRE